MTVARRRRLTGTAAALLAALALGTGCTARAGGDSVTVFAAASLTTVFTIMTHSFELQHPGTDVRLQFAGSSDLARQIVDGAPADVFAGANTASVKPILDAGLADGVPGVFARNALVIAVQHDNPLHITALADLERSGFAFAQCDVEVPCGTAAGAALRAAHVSAPPVTYERDVRAVLTRVALGEVDAGLVYRTDVLAELGRVSAVEFPESAAAINDYPILRLKSARHGRAAQSFVDYVLSPAGRHALTDAGFLPAS